MKFTPNSNPNSGFKAPPLVPEGFYKFRVTKAVDGKSKKNKDDMVTLAMIVVNAKYSATIKDWIGAWEYGDIKATQFCEAAGLPLNGELTARAAVNTTGYLEIKHRESTNDKYPGLQHAITYMTRADMEREGLLKPQPATTPAPASAPAPAPVVNGVAYTNGAYTNGSGVSHKPDTTELPADLVSPAKAAELEQAATDYFVDDDVPF